MYKILIALLVSTGVAFAQCGPGGTLIGSVGPYPICSTTGLATSVTQGASLPATCAVGQVFVLTGSPANVYYCSAVNTWTVFSSSSSGISAVNGTTQQITSSTASGTVTLSLPNNLLFPGTPSFTASTTSGASFTIPSGVAPTTPASGNFWNLSGVLQYYDGTTTQSLVNANVTTLSSLASVGTITSGTWNGSVVIGTYGGTGVNNGTKTLTLGGNTTFSGAFNPTLSFPSSSTWTFFSGGGSIAPLASPTFTGTVTTPNLTVSGMTGGPFCVHETSGVLSATAADCGSGSGGANANGFYLVNQSTNAPTNAINLGALTTGLLKMTVSGGVATISTAVAGTDYAAATSGTSILKGNGSGGFSNAVSGTDYAPATSGSSILYGNGSGGFSNVTIGSNLTFSSGTLSAATTSAYATIDNNGTSVTQRSTVNFISGPNVTANCVDNSGATRTDCTISATGNSISMAEQLGDLQVTKTASTQLTVCANCSNTTPAEVAFRWSHSQIISPGLLTISGSGTDYAYIYYINGTGVIVGSPSLNANLNCSGSCTIASGAISAFPTNSIPIAQVHATSGVWDTITNAMDSRSFLGTANVLGATGVTVSDSSGDLTASVDQSVVPYRVSVPSALTNACTPGNWAMDTNWHYVCEASGDWSIVPWGSDNGGYAINYVAGGGTAQAQTATFVPPLTGLQDGQLACWKPTAANTATAPTFAPNGLTAHTIVKDPNATALAANDLITTQIACAIYDATGTQWELQNPATAASGSGGYATIDSNGTAVTQRNTVNFISGSGATFSCADNSGASRTDCTVSSNPTGSIQYKTASYPATTTDFANSAVFEFTSGTNTLTLPINTGQPAANQCITAINVSSGQLTIARNGQNINNSATNIGLNPGGNGAASPGTATICSDGTNYVATSFPGFRGASGDILTSSGGGASGPSATANNLSSINYITGGGTAQIQTATFSPAATSLQDGMQICYKPSNANTGAAPTFAPNGLVAHTVVKVPNATALVANDLITTQIACMVYDSTGTQWELQNPATAASGSGSPAWNSITNATANMSISNAGFTTTINQTSAVTETIANTTAAVVGTSQSSPIMDLCGNAFHASASATDCLTMQDIPGNGNDAAITFAFGHSGTSTGTVTTTFPGPVQSTISGTLYQDAVSSATTTTTTEPLFATSTAGVYSPRTIATTDLPTLSVTVNPGGVTCTIGSTCGIPTTGSFASKTSSYTATTTDFTNSATIYFTGSGANTLTLVATASQPPAGQCITFLNMSTGQLTIARNGQNINGVASNAALNPGGNGTSLPGYGTACSDGTNYIVANFPGFKGATGQVMIGQGSGSAYVGTTTTTNLPLFGDSTTGVRNGMALGSGTGTAGKLACATASNTQGNCTSTSQANFSVLGVFSSTTNYVDHGITSVTLDATASPVFNDYVCYSTTTAGDAHENGTTPCTAGQGVGIVTTSATSVTSATIQVHLY